MTYSQRFPYVVIKNGRGESTPRPMLPLTLAHQTRSIETLGLVDSGADVSVLPYTVGLELGLVWDTLPNRFQLSGNLANIEARGVILTASLTGFPPVKLAFAWTRAASIGLILGQVNFFLEYRVCFSRTSLDFEVTRKA